MEKTIEEKAKAYDIAIEKAKEWKCGLAGNGDLNTCLEDLFSELAESEDDKIKDWIIDGIKFYNNAIEDPIMYKEAVSWLEKQGEQKLVPKFKVGDWVVNKFGDVWHIDSFDNKNYQVSNGDKYNYFPISKQNEMHLWTIQDAKDGDVLFTRNKNIFIFKSFSGCTIYDYCGLYFEKFKDFSATVNGSAAVQLPIDYVPATKEQRDLLFQKMKEAGYEWDAEKKELKKIEQKPTDKVEPKFREGDWVLIEEVKGYKNGPFQIKTVDSFGYSFDEYHTIPFMYEDLLSKWTIQDAKDGDILCTYECDEPKIVFILKGTPKKHYALSYHCYYNIMYPHFGSDSEKGCLSPNDEDVKPATKEQRDTLMKAMADAGYEWDAEKKELKKIEQKPVEWSEEDKNIWHYVYHLCFLARQAAKTFPDAELAQDCMDWLKSLRPQSH